MAGVQVLGKKAKRSPAFRSALTRLKECVRGRFGLADDARVLVAQIACTSPGCPPLETVVMFWTGEGRHQFRVFKPVIEVGEDDVPCAWLKRALLASDDGGDCC